MDTLHAPRFDTVVIGAGAAGLFCAAIAGQRGLKVLVIDHSEKVAEKIRNSGGGRCNFTNRDVSPTNFLSDNPHFCLASLRAPIECEGLQSASVIVVSDVIKGIALAPIEAVAPPDVVRSA